jgi:uncharacterized membrane protein YfcA
MSVLALGLAAALSLAMGLNLGLLGGGGSIMAVPVLIYVLAVETKAAIASSLLIVGATSAVGLARHARAGNVRWRIGGLFAAASMLGSYGGGRASAHVPGMVLLLLLAGMMFTTAIVMLRPGRASTRAKPSRRVPTAEIILEALALGAFTGLIGAGGGFLVVPTLLLFGGLSMREAVGTSLLVIALNSLAGFAGHAAHATVSWPLTALVAGVAAIGAVSGSVLSPRLPQRILRRAFACLVLTMGVILVAGQVPPPIRAALLPWWPLWLAVGAAAMAVLCRRTFHGPRALGVS